MPSVGQRHRHIWSRVVNGQDKHAGKFECLACGALAVMNGNGFVQVGGRKRKAVQR